VCDDKCRSLNVVIARHLPRHLCSSTGAWYQVVVPVTKLAGVSVPASNAKGCTPCMEYLVKATPGDNATGTRVPGAVLVLVMVPVAKLVCTRTRSTMYFMLAEKQPWWCSRSSLAASLHTYVLEENLNAGTDSRLLRSMHVTAYISVL